MNRDSVVKKVLIVTGIIFCVLIFLGIAVIVVSVVTGSQAPTGEKKTETGGSAVTGSVVTTGELSEEEAYLAYYEELYNSEGPDGYGTADYEYMYDDLDSPALVRVRKFLDSIPERVSNAECITTSDEIVDTIRKRINEDGTVETIRPNFSAYKPMGEPDTWSVYIYMCGTDLESESGCAQENLDSLAAQNFSDNVHFYIEGGGTRDWKREDMLDETCARYELRDGEMVLLEELGDVDMSEAASLENFLTWGVTEHPAEKMMVILWNHGGGPVYGVCSDELHDGQTLSMMDIESAFSNTCRNMTDKFELVLFDACLMGSVEVCDIMASYARYMVAAEEVLAGYGTNYEILGQVLSDYSYVNGRELAWIIVEAFKAKAYYYEDEKTTYLAAADLSAVDTFTREFDKYMKEVYNASADIRIYADLVRSSHWINKFGPNSEATGYYNLVDLNELIANMSYDVKNAEACENALDDMVINRIVPENCETSGGLSIYYPLKVSSGDELYVLNQLNPSPNYLGYIGKVIYGARANGDFTKYSLDKTTDFWLDSSEKAYKYWNSIVPEENGESKILTFDKAPHVENNKVSFTMDGVGRNSINYVDGMLTTMLDDDEYWDLGYTSEITGDTDTGVFSDGFCAEWLCIGGEQLLTSYLDEIGDYGMYIYCPVSVNGCYGNLIVFVDNERNVSLEGFLADDEDSTLSGRVSDSIEAGDEIIPLYTVRSISGDSGDDEEYVEGDPYKWTDTEDDLSYGVIPDGEYEYTLYFEDIFQNYVFSEPFAVNVRGYDYEIKSAE